MLMLLCVKLLWAQLHWIINLSLYSRVKQVTQPQTTPLPCISSQRLVGDSLTLEWNYHSVSLGRLLTRENQFLDKLRNLFWEQFYSDILSCYRLNFDSDPINYHNTVGGSANSKMSSGRKCSCKHKVMVITTVNKQACKYFLLAHPSSWHQRV